MPNILKWSIRAILSVVVVSAMVAPAIASPPSAKGGAYSYTWHRYGDHEYALTSSRTYWIDNEAEAVSVGGHLVAIETEAENTWLKTTFANTYCVGYDGNSMGACAQIGYYNRPSNGQWEWVSGAPVGYKNYASDFPHGGVYAYIHVNPHPTAGAWNANPPHTTGSNLTYGIIERQYVAPVTVTSFTPSSGKVGDGVAIYGTNFTGLSGVKFNGTVATTYSLVSDTLISATVPDGATTGPISVTASAGTGASADNFTVYDPVQLELLIDLGAAYLGAPNQVQLNYILSGPQEYNGVLPMDGGGMALFTDLQPGTYSLTLFGNHWLKRVLPGLILDGFLHENISLTNGDSNGDNQVNLFDFVVLDSKFGSAFGMADLDGSGVVNLFDYVMIDTNFGALGD